MGWMAKVATLYERTGRTKPTCQDVMAFTAAEFKFAMAVPEKLQMFERILVWNFLKFQRKDKNVCKYLKIFFLIYFKNFECMKNFAVKDGFL